MNKDIKPLYRKQNTKARNFFFCGQVKTAKWDKGTKKGVSKTMAKQKPSGYDYTPLYKFLLSKVGQDWDSVYSQAKSRLNDEKPIFYMVDVNNTYISPITGKEQVYFLGGENSYFSVLIVDEQGILRYKDPTLKNEDFIPSCPCCTHTFNGKVLNKKFISPYK